MNNNVTLWIPALRPAKQFASELGNLLQQLPKQQHPQINSLNRLLSRADRIVASDVIKHDFILQQLLSGNDHVTSWPIAKWRLAVDDEKLMSKSDFWLCADPVYIYPDRSEALLYAHEELNIDIDEAHSLVELINQHYQDDGWQLYVGSAYRWYIKLDKYYEIKTSTLKSAKGKNIFDYLPSGKDSRYWQQCMNEIQMLMHSSEVNQHREEQGLLPINSLWFWGYGPALENDQLPWDYIYSNDAVLNGFGISAGSKVNALPVSLDKLKTGDRQTLVYFDKLATLLQQQDIYGWLDELQSLEDNWIKPLLERVARQGMTLTVLLDDNEAYRLSAKQLKRWWRFNQANKLL